MLPPIFARWLPVGVAGLLFAFPGLTRADESLPPLPAEVSAGSAPAAASPGGPETGRIAASDTAREQLPAPDVGLPPLPTSITGAGADLQPTGRATPAPLKDAGSTGRLQAATDVPPRQLLAELGRIADLKERSLALQRVAKTWTGSDEISAAHEALSMAAGAALSIANPAVRDSHLTESITLLLALADADLRLGKRILTAPIETRPTGEAGRMNPTTLIQHAEVEWARIAYLAARITDPTYRNENMFRLVDGESFGARAIAKEFRSPPGANDARPTEPFIAAADRILRKATQHAEAIERIVWRDRALAEAATNAAGGLRFELALEIVRKVQRPEPRTDALIKIAETQALKGNDPEQAHATYEEAARTVASIAQPDPRAVLTTALIENLILVRRYDDARANIVLYPDRDHRLKALTSVAFSQGRTGQGAAAKKWIARDIPEQFRPLLNRKVEEGTLELVEETRARSLVPVR